MAVLTPAVAKLTGGIVYLKSTTVFITTNRKIFIVKVADGIPPPPPPNATRAYGFYSS